MQKTFQKQPEQPKPKSPSYLSQVKDELINIIIPDNEATEQDAQTLIETLWTFMSKKLAQSYWNGVSGGASGRVKPKEWKSPSQPKS